MDTEHIRNFSIIAHIDHGKSTLADRLIEITGTVQKRDMEAQILDTMELERERGITIKEQSVRLNYTYEDGETYELNLIDTPGHVDFNYEVSRSLSACEGAILIIDATQGVQAQTLANVYLALDHDLEIIPVINKVDLPSADVERVKTEVENVIGLDMSEAIPVSAKTGQNVEEVLKRIVEQVPPPEDHSKAPLRCLIFDSIFDSYKGAIAYVRVKDGEIRAGMNIRMMASGKVYTVTEVGYFSPFPKPCDVLTCGSVGYWQAEALLTVIGIGTGMIFPVGTVSVQNAVTRRDLGVAMGALAFVRSLGSVVAVSVLGAVLATVGIGAASGAASGDAHADPVAAGLFVAPFATVVVGQVIGFVVLCFLEERPLRGHEPPPPEAG